jgi:hypothetical protein
MPAAATALLRMGRLAVSLGPRLRPESLMCLRPLLKVLLRPAESRLTVHGRSVSHGTGGVILSARARRTVRSQRPRRRDVHRAACRTGSEDAVTAEDARSGRGGDGRTAVVGVSAQRAVGEGHALLALLYRSEGDVMVVRSRHLCPRGVGYNPSGSTVEADMRVSPAMRVGARINVGHEGWPNMDDCAVVHECSSAPVAALVAGAVISEAVVHATVKADVNYGFG